MVKEERITETFTREEGNGQLMERKVVDGESGQEKEKQGHGKDMENKEYGLREKGKL